MSRRPILRAVFGLIWSKQSNDQAVKQKRKKKKEKRKKKKEKRKNFEAKSKGAKKTLVVNKSIFLEKVSSEVCNVANFNS